MLKKYFIVRESTIASVIRVIVQFRSNMVRNNLRPDHGRHSTSAYVYLPSCVGPLTSVYSSSWKELPTLRHLSTRRHPSQRDQIEDGLFHLDFSELSAADGRRCSEAFAMLRLLVYGLLI